MDDIKLTTMIEGRMHTIYVRLCDPPRFFAGGDYMELTDHLSDVRKNKMVIRAKKKIK